MKVTERCKLAYATSLPQVSLGNNGGVGADLYKPIEILANREAAGRRY
jgi:hypothetical protein